MHEHLVEVYTNLISFLRLFFYDSMYLLLKQVELSKKMQEPKLDLKVRIYLTWPIEVKCGC